LLQIVGHSDITFSKPSAYKQLYVHAFHREASARKRKMESRWRSGGNCQTTNSTGVQMLSGFI